METENSKLQKLKETLTGWKSGASERADLSNREDEVNWHIHYQSEANTYTNVIFEINRMIKSAGEGDNEN